VVLSFPALFRMLLGVSGTLSRVNSGDLLRQCQCDIVSRCRYVDLEIWHGPSGLVRKKEDKRGGLSVLCSLQCSRYPWSPLPHAVLQEYIRVSTHLLARPRGAQAPAATVAGCVGPAATVAGCVGMTNPGAAEALGTVPSNTFIAHAALES
jgi:hypothetical protein